MTTMSAVEHETKNEKYAPSSSTKLEDEGERGVGIPLGTGDGLQTRDGSVLVSFGFRGGWETKAQHRGWATTFGSCPPLSLVD